MPVYHKKVIILFSSLMLFLCLVAQVRAATFPFINKSKIRIAISPGQRGYGEIIMENPTEKERSMRLYLEDWYYLPAADGTKEFIPAGTFSRSCASWISFSPAEFIIFPFSKQKISYSIQVPEDASGGYYAALFFETLLGQTEQAKEGMSAGMDLNVRIASLFYIETTGTVKRKVAIDNLKLEKEPSSERLLIQLDFTNTGNTDITAGGTFHIMDKKGLISARGEFKDVYTFPGDKAKLNALWKERIPKGKYDLVLTLNLGKALEEVKFGRGPVITKEAEIEIDAQGEVIRVGGLK